MTPAGFSVLVISLLTLKAEIFNIKAEIRDHLPSHSFIILGGTDAEGFVPPGTSSLPAGGSLSQHTL